MNGKIPILGTVGSAYGFLFGHFMTVVRLSWVWLLAAAVLQYMWTPGIEAAMAEFTKSQNPDTLSPVLGQIFAMSAVSLLGTLIVFVALLRVVISGDSRPGVPLHLFSGMPDLRLIAAVFLLFVAFAAAAIAFAFVMGFATILTGPAGAGIMVLLLAAVMIYVGLGLSLVAPVASVEPNLGVERSWELMKGNRLRLFVASILTFLPFGLVIGVIFAAVVLPQVGPMPQFPQGLEPEAAGKAFQKAFEEYTNKIDAVLKQDVGLYVGGLTLLNLLSLGLQAGLYGHAYRAATRMDGE